MDTRELPSLKPLVMLNASMVGVIIALFLILPTVAPTTFVSMWGPAYVVGTPVAVELPSSCEVETVTRKGKSTSTATCAGTTWTVDGRRVTGTLRAKPADIDRGASGELVFTGAARAFGDTVYGHPGAAGIVVPLTLLAAVGVGALTLLGAAVTAAWRSMRGGRQRARGPDAEGLWHSPELRQLGTVRSRHISTYSYLWLVLSELALVALAFGITLVIFSAGTAAVAGACVAAVAALATTTTLAWFVREAWRAGRDLTVVCEHGLLVWRTGIAFTCPWTAARFTGTPAELDQDAAPTPDFTVRSADARPTRSAPATGPGSPSCAPRPTARSRTRPGPG